MVVSDLNQIFDQKQNTKPKISYFKCLSKFRESQQYKNGYSFWEMIKTKTCFLEKHALMNCAK